MTVAFRRPCRCFWVHSCRVTGLLIRWAWSGLALVLVLLRLAAVHGGVLWEREDRCSPIGASLTLNSVIVDAARHLLVTTGTIQPPCSAFGLNPKGAAGDNDNVLVVAFDTTSGAVAWSQQLGVRPLQPGGEASISGISIMSDGTPEQEAAQYFISGSVNGAQSFLVALDADTHAVLWNITSQIPLDFLQTFRPRLRETEGDQPVGVGVRVRVSDPAAAGTWMTDSPGTAAVYAADTFRVMAFNASDGQLLWLTTLNQNFFWITGLAISPDGQLLAASMKLTGSSVWFFNASTGAQVSSMAAVSDQYGRGK